MTTKTIFLPSGLILLLFLGLVFSTVGSNLGETQTMEKGITTTFLIPTGGYSGSQSITFPKPFPTPPNITLTQLSTNPLSQNIADAISIVASGTSVTWTGMPALQTELFGNANNRARTNDQNPIQMWFAVDVLTPGTGTATLRVQTSPDQTTWSDPCSTPGTADLSIATPGGLIVTACSLSLPFNSFLRIIGFNGNGVVSPVFGLITVTFITTEQGILTLIPLSVTTTGFLLFGNLSLRSGGNQITIQWIAMECNGGGDIC